MTDKMTDKNHKPFLYLVQARAALAQKHLSLESARADVLIYTFDEEIKGKQFLYKANTIWAEGRNILIEHAKKLSTQYDYFVLMDDDLIFESGSYREFEDEVQKIKPDMAMPNYISPQVPHWYAAASPLRYSNIYFADCAFVCLTKELFYDKRLLPYHTAYLSLSIFGRNSIYYSYLFWINLCEYFGKKKLINFNKISFSNPNRNYTYKDSGNLLLLLLNLVHKENPSFSNRIKRAMPFYYYLYERSYYGDRYCKYFLILTRHYGIGTESVTLFGIRIPGSRATKICWFFIKNQFATNRPPKNIEGDIANRIEDEEKIIKGKMATENRAAKLKHLRIYMALLFRLVMSQFVYNRLVFALLHLWKDTKLNIKIYLR